MDTKKISSLLAAVRAGSLTSAAAGLGYTQSGLTHMMNALEDELGLTLLLRSKTGVCLSPDGQELFEAMEALSQAAEALEEKAEELRKRNFSFLRLGAYSSVVRHWMPAVLKEFRRSNPDTEVSLNAGSIEDIYEWLRADKIDCAIVSYQKSLMQGLSWIPLRDDSLVAVLPYDFEPEKEVFPVEDFSGKEFLMPSDCFELDINPVFELCEHKVTPRISYINLDDAAIASMVELGLGVSILSELVIQNMPNRIRALPLNPPASRQLGIILSEKRQNDRNIRHFVRCIQSVLAKIYPED